MTRRSLRELLARAGESFEAVSLASRAEYDGPLLQRALEHSVSDLAERLRSGTAAPLRVAGEQAGIQEGGRVVHDWRVWWRRPSCWREDLAGPDGGTVVSIACGDAALSYVSRLSTLYTKGRPGRAPLRSILQRRPQIDFPPPTVADRLAHVPPLLPWFNHHGWELTETGECVFAGRGGVRLRAIRIDPAAPEGFWEYVDHYEVVVDLERGVVLRCAAMVEGIEAGTFSIRSVRFDEPIPDDVFSVSPPEGTRIVES
ncbi:MAG TPA: hypothetical protein VF613_13635 [Longimicrobium sp.]|jgi:hypothetical protein